MSEDKNIKFSIDKVRPMFSLFFLALFILSGVLLWDGNNKWGIKVVFVVSGIYSLISLIWILIEYIRFKKAKST